MNILEKGEPLVKHDEANGHGSELAKKCRSEVNVRATCAAFFCECLRSYCECFFEFRFSASYGGIYPLAAVK